ncbi:uncharacterized protein LOC127365919 [Dicentrarchus labrax]|uniref:uncharacterized protein LOC127365919 n=1 Tax=Dicentrarchus labrax TaxID=13489 RepID=UPI0021F54D23|nr:uncharacterized protein LOC127365919 [Dicentrarchus labrax]
MRGSRNAKMTAQARHFNIFISCTIYLSFTFRKSHGFEVIQPQNQTVNSDGSASISCEHTANGTIVDVRLIGISLGDKPIQTILCQKGMDACDKIIMHQENPKKFLFILLNIGPVEMNKKYECEFTVKCDNDVDYTSTGRQTELLPGQKEAVCISHPPPPPSSPPPPPLPVPLSHELRWILIGLLALMFLYSCVITSFYIRLRFSNREPDNSTYVVMRKAPLQRNPPLDIYCG